MAARKFIKYMFLLNKWDPLTTWDLELCATPTWLRRVKSGSPGRVGFRQKDIQGVPFSWEVWISIDLSSRKGEFEYQYKSYDDDQYPKQKGAISCQQTIKVIPIPKGG